MLTLLISLTLTFEPVPQRCDDDPDKNKVLTRDAVEHAKQVLSGAKTVEACELSAKRRLVTLEPTELKVGDVKFVVHPRVFGVKEDEWKLVPFADANVAKDIARRISSHPLVKKALPGKITCLATSDAPGETAWFLCRAPGDVPKEDYEWSTPTSGHMEGEITEVEFSFGRGDSSCGCEPFTMLNFSVPLAKVPADTVGWCQVKDANKVKNFLAKNKEPMQLTVARWKQYSAKLRMKDGTTHEEQIAPAARDCACLPPPSCLK